MIGQRDQELEWLKKNCQSLTSSERLQCIEKGDTKITLKRQCELLGLSRAAPYYTPREISQKDIATMNTIDQIYTEHPYYGNRRMKAELNYTHNIPIGRDHVRTLMKTMGIEAIYPKKNLSFPNKNHKIYAYLLRNMIITKPNHVWSTDITYVKLRNGFAYLIAVIDWFSRYVLSWRISNSLDIEFCLERLKDALKKYKPNIFNTDQGSHFTSSQFTNILEDKKIQISMDGRGRCLDNIFVERLWRSVKQKKIYLNDYQNVTDVRNGLNEYFDFYNTKRRHQSLNYAFPRDVYFSK